LGTGRGYGVLTDNKTGKKTYMRMMSVGGGDAAAKSGNKGGAVSGVVLIDENIEVYHLTESGIATSAMVSGTKYWKDKEINQGGLCFIPY